MFTFLAMRQLSHPQRHVRNSTLEPNLCYVPKKSHDIKSIGGVSLILHCKAYKKVRLLGLAHKTAQTFYVEKFLKNLANFQVTSATEHYFDDCCTQNYPKVTIFLDSKLEPIHFKIIH